MIKFVQDCFQPSSIKKTGRKTNFFYKTFVHIRHQKIVPFIDEYSSFYTWAHIANEELIWYQLANNLGNEDLEFDYSKYTHFQNEKKLR